MELDNIISKGQGECRRLSIDAGQCGNYLENKDIEGALHNLDEVVEYATKLKDSLKEYLKNKS